MDQSANMVTINDDCMVTMRTLDVQLWHLEYRIEHLWLMQKHCTHCVLMEREQDHYYSKEFEHHHVQLQEYSHLSDTDWNH
jgi:hypothetical protein